MPLMNEENISRDRSMNSFDCFFMNVATFDCLPLVKCRVFSYTPDPYLSGEGKQVNCPHLGVRMTEELQM